MTRREGTWGRAVGTKIGSSTSAVVSGVRALGRGRRGMVRPPLRDVAPRPGHTATFALHTDAFMAQRAERAWPPPPEVVQALTVAQRVVTIGHTPPDGDCVGAALGLARGLRMLGRQAHAIVDADLPAGLRSLGRQGDLHRTPPPFQPDLVVLVDVAQAERIGEARAMLPTGDSADGAPAVMVVDHHRVMPTHAQLGVCDDLSLTTWIDDRCDAASLQVASLLEALGGAPDGWGNDWSYVAAPLAAGIATDTQWFRSPRVNARSLAVFKGLLDSDLNALEDLEARLSHALPDTATAFLSAYQSSVVLRHGATTAAELAVPASVRSRALAMAQSADPRTTIEDVSGHLMDRLDRLAGRHRVAVLLQEEEMGNVVRVSIRSRDDDLAVGLADELGGGGKRGVAGATVQGRLSAVQARVRRLIAGQCAAVDDRQARLA